MSRSLKEPEKLFAAGERDGKKLAEFTEELIKTEQMADIDYVEIYRMPDLSECSGPLEGAGLLAVAVRFGKTRLIDNLVLEVK